MTATTDYAATTRRVQSAFTGALETWKKSLNSVTGQFQAIPSIDVPQFDPITAVEQQFAVIKQLVDVNQRFAIQLAEVTDKLTGVTRQQIESVSSAVRDQVQTFTEAARSNVDDFEKTVRHTAEQVEETERQAAHDLLAAQYEGLTKAELSKEAAKRNLSKVGTVSQLIERLIEDDTK